MYEKMHGIVLHTLKYNDKNSIVHVLSRERGRVSFLLSQGSGRSARMRNALFMPLSILDIEAKVTVGRDICTIKDVRPAEIIVSIYSDPAKNAIAMFISELVGKVIQGSEDSSHIYDYVEAAVKMLEVMEGSVANFHICFLYRLGGILGITPDVATYREGYGFNMNEGVFMPYYNNGAAFMISPSDALLLKNLDRIRFSNMHLFRFNREQRNMLLDKMLKYYQIHNSTLGNLKSPEILSQLFD